MLQPGGEADRRLEVTISAAGVVDLHVPALRPSTGCTSATSCLDAAYGAPPTRRSRHPRQVSPPGSSRLPQHPPASGEVADRQRTTAAITDRAPIRHHGPRWRSPWAIDHRTSSACSPARVRSGSTWPRRRARLLRCPPYHSAAVNDVESLEVGEAAGRLLERDREGRRAGRITGDELVLDHGRVRRGDDRPAQPLPDPRGADVRRCRRCILSPRCRRPWRRGGGVASLLGRIARDGVAEPGRPHLARLSRRWGGVPPGDDPRGRG